jgi:hypothetical protein
VRSIGGTAPRRMVVVRGPVVAGAERHELAGGEVLRASDGNIKTVRVRAIYLARNDLRARANTTETIPRPYGHRSLAGDGICGGAFGLSRGSALQGSAERGVGRFGHARTC